MSYLLFRLSDLDTPSLALVTYFCFSVESPEKDWEDIKFGVENKVDFYALSFVKDAQVVHELKSFLKGMFRTSFLCTILRIVFWWSVSFIEQL